MKFLADRFGEDIHVDLLKSGRPTFEESLADELGLRGMTVSEAFGSFQRWFEEKRSSRSGGGEVADTPKTEAFTLNFAHFANGDSITSDLVFVNVGTEAIRPEIYFYDKRGALIGADSVVDIAGDLEVKENGALTVRNEIASLGELTISTHGRGEVVTGSVRVVSYGLIGGVLRFDGPGLGVAGVGSSQPVQDAIFPARRRLGGIRTATAIRNLGEEPLVVSCRLMKNGIVLEEVDIPLRANGQEARFVEELFTRTDTSEFVGSVRCTALEDGKFTGVALEMDAGNRIFTTLPIVPVQP